MAMFGRCVLVVVKRSCGMCWQCFGYTSCFRAYMSTYFMDGEMNDAVTCSSATRALATPKMQEETPPSMPNELRDVATRGGSTAALQPLLQTHMVAVQRLLGQHHEQVTHYDDFSVKHAFLHHIFLYFIGPKFKFVYFSKQKGVALKCWRILRDWTLSNKNKSGNKCLFL